MRTLGVIPARGGSKGVPRKNISLLMGKPLITYTIEAAHHSSRLQRTIVTTDDAEIASIARQWGADVPFFRPADLAADHTPMLPVLQHVVAEIEKSGEQFDLICLLQPTNPLRMATDIDGCIDLLVSTGADTVFTVLRVPHEHNPHWVFEPDHDGFLKLSTGEPEPISRRQELPLAYHREGSVYVVRRDVLMLQNTLYGPLVAGFEVDAARSVNIDESDDWRRAAELMAARMGA